MSSAWPAIPGTEVEICSLREVLNVHGGDGKWLMVWQYSNTADKRVERSLALGPYALMPYIYSMFYLIVC